MASGEIPAGWYADPSGGDQQRYWDGAQWTEQYAGGGAPSQVRFTSTNGGEYLATFDGVVLDLFGADVPGRNESARFHRDLLTITIGDPDRKGTRTVAIYAGPGPGRQVPTRYISVAEQDLFVIDFFERVRASLPVG
jgi:hypothetical protein